MPKVEFYSDSSVKDGGNTVFTKREVKTIKNKSLVENTDSVEPQIEHDVIHHSRKDQSVTDNIFKENNETKTGIITPINIANISEYRRDLDEIERNGGSSSCPRCQY